MDAAWDPVHTITQSARPTPTSPTAPRTTRGTTDNTTPNAAFHHHRS